MIPDMSSEMLYIFMAGTVLPAVTIIGCFAGAYVLVRDALIGGTK